ncbi:uncharacterized protein LOC107303467 [Oryza brachyantha]|uniref:uncharacterized protein LOC107303467 n=1 Tax=Oryza brachyantha TaxID=4533 RepID=UPI00077615AA|nr:uncharacterized protein LOC107303467 [Oryza brachyantha]
MLLPIGRTRLPTGDRQYLLQRANSRILIYQIIGTTILEKQIVHGALCKLWKDDYIDTEPKTGGNLRMLQVSRAVPSSEGTGRHGTVQSPFQFSGACKCNKVIFPILPSLWTCGVFIRLCVNRTSWTTSWSDPSHDHVTFT